jgi:purine-binding chemotaxis protein CheW
MQPDNRSISSTLGMATPEASLASDQTKQFITFTLDALEYGIDIMVVREIKGWAHTTMIPNAPPHVRGVINLRGIIVPIFDLRARFGMGLTEPTRMHVVIIVATGRRTVGLLVDAVSDIISIDPKAIRPVPDMGIASDGQFLEGLVAMEERMVTLVSLSGLFGSDAEAKPAAGDSEATRAA